MEFFRNPNIHFLKYKWYFLAMSLVLSVVGVLSMIFWHGVPLGVEFRGGTVVEVKFTHPPDNNAIRHALDKAGLHNARIQSYGDVANHEVLIALDIRETTEQALANRLRVGVGDLAAQEAHRETRHGAGLYSSRRKRSAAQPSEMLRLAGRKPSGSGRSDSR